MEDAYQTWRSQGVEAGLKRFEAVIGMVGTPPEQPPGPPTPEMLAAWGAHQRQPRVLPRPRHPADQRLRPRRGRPARRPGEDRGGHRRELGGAARHRAGVALAERLGTPPVTFPGDHGGFGSRPGPFAETLHRVLVG
jgi:hypothetical protein